MLRFGIGGISDRVGQFDGIRTRGPIGPMMDQDDVLAGVQSPNGMVMSGYLADRRYGLRGVLTRDGECAWLEQILEQLSIVG